MELSLPSTSWLTIYKTLHILRYLDYLLPQAFKYSPGNLSRSPPLVGQIILKCKCVNVTSTTCHLNGLHCPPFRLCGLLHIFFSCLQAFTHAAWPTGNILSPHCPHLLANLYLFLHLNLNFTFSWKLSQHPQTSLLYYYTNHTLITAFYCPFYQNTNFDRIGTASVLFPVINSLPDMTIS